MPEKPRDSKRAFLDLKGKDRRELIWLMTQLGADVDSIKGQLEKAKQDFRTTKKRADNDWYRRATGMLLVKGRQIQQIQARLSELKLSHKKQLPHVFMKHAELILPQEEFKKILKKALEECDDPQKEDTS